VYLGWLAAVTAGELEEDEREPPLPAGMKQPTAAQRALVEFLEVDPDLLVGAVPVAGTARSIPGYSRAVGISTGIPRLAADSFRSRSKHANPTGCGITCRLMASAAAKWRLS
jgi:hypothetical protein